MKLLAWLTVPVVVICVLLGVSSGVNLFHIVVMCLVGFVVFVAPVWIVVTIVRAVARRGG